MNNKKNGLKVALVLGAVSIAAIQPAFADAILTAADVTAAADSSGADASLKAGALWALGLTIATVVIVKVLGIVKR